MQPRRIMHHQTRMPLQFSCVSCVLHNLKFKGTAISFFQMSQITFKDLSLCEERRLNLFEMVTRIWIGLVVHHTLSAEINMGWPKLVFAWFGSCELRRLNDP